MNKLKIYKRIGISPILHDLITSDAILKQKSDTAIIEDIIEAHYTNGTALHKKLNFIIKHIEAITGESSGINTSPEDLFDIPAIPLEEIQAARYNRKRYSKREVPNSERQPAKPKVDFRDITNFLGG